MNVDYQRMDDDGDDVGHGKSNARFSSSIYAPGEVADNDMPNMDAILQYGNVEALISDVYQYYRAGGFYQTLMSRCSMAVLPVLACLAACLGIFFVDWRSIVATKFPHGASQNHAWFAKQSEHATQVTIAACAACLVVGFALNIWGVVKAWRIRRCFRDHLGIVDADTNLVSWTWMCRRIAARQPKMLGYNGTDWRHVAAFLCRRQNYLLHMFQTGTLPTCISSASQWLPGRKWTVTSSIYTRCLMWILSPIFDDTTLGTSGASAIMTRVCKRSFSCAVLLLVALPAVLVGAAIYLATIIVFGFRLPSTKSVGSPTPVTWTPMARLELACFDESPCQVEERLSRVQNRLQKLGRLCKTGRATHVASFASTVLKLFLGLLLVASMIDANIASATMWETSKSVLWSPSPIVFTGYIISALLAISSWVSAAGRDSSNRDQRICKIVNEISCTVVMPCRAATGEDVDWNAIASLDLKRTIHPGVYRKIGHIVEELQQTSAEIVLRELWSMVHCIAIFSRPSPENISRTMSFFQQQSTPISPGLAFRLAASASFDNANVVPSLVQNPGDCILDMGCSASPLLATSVSAADDNYNSRRTNKLQESIDRFRIRSLLGGDDNLNE